MKKILIIDDNSENREVLELLLEDEGFDTKALAGPRDIDTVISEFAPDLILLDVMMPGYNGIEESLRIKSMPKFAHIKIVLLTASNAFKNLDQSSTLADAFIAKPFDIDEVTTLVKSLLKI